MAGTIAEILKTAGFETDIFPVQNFSSENLQSYDIFVMGSSTWADGDLQEHFRPFEIEMEDIDMSGKFAACFGPGNSRFPRFCEAVEILQARLKSSGARIIIPSLKSDELSGTVESDTEDWARALVRELELLN